MPKTGSEPCALSLFFFFADVNGEMEWMERNTLRRKENKGLATQIQGLMLNWLMRWKVRSRSEDDDKCELWVGRGGGVMCG